MAPGRAVGVDDALLKQVLDALPDAGLVGAVEVVEGVVLADHDDHVLDRRGRVGGPGLSDGTGEQRHRRRPGELVCPNHCSLS